MAQVLPTDETSIFQAPVDQSAYMVKNIIVTRDLIMSRCHTMVVFCVMISVYPTSQ